jgi:hypothetical protein
MQPMWYREDPILQEQAAEQRARELQHDAERQRYIPDDPRYKRRTGRSAIGARWGLGLVVLLIIVGIAGFLLVNR